MSISALYLKRLGYLWVGVVSLVGISLLPSSGQAQRAKQVSRSYVNHQYQHYTKEEVANLLGWVKAGLFKASGETRYCHGYYENAPILCLPDSSLPLNTEPFVHLKADQTVLQPRHGYSYLHGHVNIYQVNRKINSDNATLVRDKHSHKITHINLNKHVRLELPGRLIVADRASIDAQKKTYVWHLLYRLLKADRSRGLCGSKEHLDVWGQAKAGVIDHDGQLHLINATYSTCPAPEQAWHLRATRADLNPKKGWGQAYNATLLIHRTPVLYLPFISFPLDARRKTGLLLPSFSHSDKGGFEFRLPYYWNIAPFTDITLTPHYIQKRGAMFDLLWRYLFPGDKGNLHIMFLPNDRAFKTFRRNALEAFAVNPDAVLGLSRLRRNDGGRGAIAFSHSMEHDPYWSGNVHINLASDDYLLFDLNTLLATEEIFHLRNSASLHYTDKHWDASGLVLTYQTLHPVNQNFVDDLYRQVPRINVTGYYSWFHSAINMVFNGEWVYFDHKSNLLTGEPIVTGSRFTLHPSFTWPFAWPSGFIRPHIEALGTYYTLEDQPADQPATITRILPILSVDAGAYFDRYFHWQGHSFKQTLEPRLFYLAIPFHNQDDIPIFDTDVLPFSFAQLFRTQRFVGVDRLGDSNQISLGVTSRLLRNNSGEEKFRASLGVIYYFHRHRVCLEPDCHRDPTAKNTFSPIVGELRYHLTPGWQIISALAWDPSRRRTNNGYLHLLYRGARQRTLYLTYQYIQNGQQSRDILGLTHIPTNDLGRVSLALNWPFGQRWSLLLSSSYNSAEGRLQAYYYGVQYNSCCWAIRFLSHNVFNAKRANLSSEFQHRYYLQIQLKGLSNIGNNDPGRLLEETIPGYRNIFK